MQRDLPQWIGFHLYVFGANYWTHQIQLSEIIQPMIGFVVKKVMKFEKQVLTLISRKFFQGIGR